MAIRVAITYPETRKFKGKLLKAITDSVPGIDIDECEVAIYWYCNDYHSGQWSIEYKMLCRSYYKPGPLCNGIDHENEMAVLAYNILVDKFQSA
jgi:hypothetical protein